MEKTRNDVLNFLIKINILKYFDDVDIDLMILALNK